MNYGSREVMDLYIFDERGNLVTKLDSLKRSYLKIDAENQVSELFVADALLNLDYLKFMQDSQDEKLTDFERYSKLYTIQTVNFNIKKTAYKKCRVIAKSVLRKVDTDEDIITVYEIPNAKIVKTFNIDNHSWGEPSVFDSLIRIEPFNENGDLFKMHIQQ